MRFRPELDQEFACPDMLDPVWYKQHMNPPSGWIGPSHNAKSAKAQEQHKDAKKWQKKWFPYASCGNEAADWTGTDDE